MFRTVLLWAALAAAANAADLKPYEVIWNPAGDVLADLSFLHDAPAGKAGFLKAQNGHIVAPDGQRVRLWGVNLSFTGSLPDKAHAENVAAHLARFGINCVRVHHLDWRFPRGIIDSQFPDSRHLSESYLDRLDWFVYQLKRRGIYTNLNLNVARAFQPGDGVKDAADLGFAKAVTYFDPRIVELEKEYARNLLGHKNPYTGTEYRNEPAVAIVEILNENSLIESWVRGRLLGKGPGKAQDRTWVDIPASYERDLAARYQQWLARTLSKEELAKLREESGSEDVARLRPAQIAGASEFRFRTEASFYMQLEDSFFQDMYSYLKKDLGVQSLIVATSVHAGNLTPYPLLSSTSKLDMVDAHTYWQHPRYLSDASGKRTGFEIPNTPSVDDPAHSAVVTLSRAAVAGKPFMISEVNHPYPNEYASEGIPLLAAYAGFQDWDAVFWYSFSHTAAETWTKPSLPGHFDMRQDPVKMTQWAAGALTFLRGDVSPAERSLDRSYTRELVLDSLRMPNSTAPYFTPNFSPLLPLLDGTRIASFTAPRPVLPDAVAGVPVSSDTKQLRWSIATSRRKALVTVDTGRTQSLIGYWDNEPAETQNMRAKLANHFGALTLVSLERAPIAQASKLLLSAGSRAANQGLKWNETRTRTVDDGVPGMLIEALEGTVSLRGLAGVKSVEAVPLDGGGRSAGAAIAAVQEDAGWTLQLGETVTPWYLIRVAR